MALSYKNITLTGASGVSSTLIGKTTMLNTVTTANSTLGTNPTSVNRVSGATTINNKLTVTGNATFSNTSSIFAVATANVNLTGTGKTLVKTANTDIRGGTLLVTSNVAVVGTGGIKFKDGTSLTSGVSGLTRAEVQAIVLSL